MTNSYINFRRQRDLGEIISDTFRFIRENYRLLLKLILKIVGPVFGLLILTLGHYYYLGGGNPFLSDNFDDRIGQFLLAISLLLISFLAFFVLLQGTVLHFIKSYIDNDGKVVEAQVYIGVKKDFGKILGTTVIVFVLTFIGLMLCVLPGIYLWVPLSFAVPFVVFNRKGALDAIGDGFNLIKENWWMTFFSLFVMTLLVYFIALIFQIPMFIYFFIKMFTVVQEGSAANPEVLFDWVYISLSVISSLVQYLLYTILIIAIAFIYYSLDEKKNFTGTYETISNLGSSDNS